ncbi:peptidoglycan DD-metalloendopeptidase family protein [Flavobacterium agrisoli]|uniref:Peptidoglycan DD-metalloendopeptidase family protein n=1 Tax=Flavobacterium agrisoli TaxID=2793066 RepID=A0A934PIY3_9FLAO|nr:peptidoglycan DD-metalloendopeptidase family protein [Flavobacterium agrisoli]MBK0368497.1 peptidoglycan DD-metalloendopeptidase family protein [Flavobacterium agrisoli]
MDGFSSILSNIHAAPIIGSVDYKSFVPIDLSKNNADLTTNRLESPQEFENYIKEYLEQNNAKVAYGGYLEERKLYQRSSIFNNNETAERSIHIGMDLWIKAETTINCPIDGEIHSFKNNTGLGDYGPTLILKHIVKNEVFYTLYGHLSLKSITNLSLGTILKKGEKLATLGYASENGNYAPHLHFQIIKNIEDHWGDYPGVCSKDTVDFYAENCPNPNLILKINKT